MSLADGGNGSGEMLEMLRPYVEARVAEFGRIDGERKGVLGELAGWVREQGAAGGPVKLTFVCTHNSRRSHLGQLWAQVGAQRFGLAGVETFSGGTEATACNIRTVRALRRAGMAMVDSGGGENPLYLAQYAEGVPGMRVFSKEYGTGGNPQDGFAAVMTCDHADRNCPLVAGAAARFPLHYRDPKEADGTAEEAAAYDERCAQIAREMLYLMSRAR